MMESERALKHLNDAELIKAIQLIASSIAVISGAHIEEKMMRITLATIKRFLLANYGFLSAAEVIKAFEINATGKQWERVGHYNRPLNCDYVGAILEQYKEYRAGNVKQIQETITQLRLEESKQQPTVITERDMQEVCNIAYADYLIDPRCNFFTVDMLYRYAFELGLISEPFESFRDVAVAQLKARTYMEQTALSGSDKATGEQVGLKNTLHDLYNKNKSDETNFKIDYAAKDISLRNAFRKFAEQKKQSIFELP